MNRLNHYNIFDRIYIIYLFLYANILLSPVIRLIGFHVREAIAVSFIIFVVCYAFLSSKVNIFVKKKNILLFFFSILIFCIPGIYYQSIDVAFYNNAYLFILILLAFWERKHIEPFLNISTIFICIVIGGAFIGFIYALYGGRAIMSFQNPDGRLNYIYITTFSNSVMGNIIRPAGVYDEPGALSFFICSICLLRMLFKKNDSTTLLIMLGGMITFSLTHFLVLICFFLHYIIKNKKKKGTLLFIFIFFLVGIIVINVFREPFEKRFFSRFRYDASKGSISGDNRTGLFWNSMELINRDIFFWGLGKNVYSESPNIGEHPLTPLVVYGLFNGGYYYIGLFAILMAGIYRRKYFFIFLAMCILFMQRPYPTKICYSFYFVVFSMCAISIIKRQLSSYAISRI